MEKFVSDAMLGKLTRWLRLAGYDVVYVGDLGIPPEKQDPSLIDIALLQNRRLLTSDIKLHRNAMRSGAKSTLIGSGDVVSQMVELCRKTKQRLKIDPEKSRCPMCNGALDRADSSSVKGLVPKKVLDMEEFWKCSSCGKVYWKGKHWKSMLKTVQRYNQIMK
ncbi:MAG: Mut7-C RNAse domain-containing protein [Candidatus Hadarchaeales archaeon]